MNDDKQQQVLNGACQCGAVTYRVSQAPLMTYACHCRDCQKRTGSAFSMGTICLVESFASKGRLAAWARTSDDGNKNTRHSCENCGNVIYGTSSNSPEAIRLQPGTLENSSEIVPDVHIWTKRAQAWVQIPESQLSYASQPDDLREILQEVIQRRSRN